MSTHPSIILSLTLNQSSEPQHLSEKPIIQTGTNTARAYLDALEQTYMIRRLLPWQANLGKRLVKTPKIYFRDSGLFHTLCGIPSAAELLTHPKLGASWEGFALEEIIQAQTLTQLTKEFSKEARELKQEIRSVPQITQQLSAGRAVAFFCVAIASLLAGILIGKYLL